MYTALLMGTFLNRRSPVTGILALEKMVLGPKFPLEKLVPRTIFSGKIGPTLKILVRPSSFSRVDLTLKICLYMTLYVWHS